MALKMQESPKDTDHKDKCSYCDDLHAVFFCTEFKALPIATWLDKVRLKKFCYNCLSKDHASAQCSSKKRCQKCQGMHHTLIHREGAEVSTVSEEAPEDSPAVNNSVASATHQMVRVSCFPRTVLVMASAGSYKQHCRA